MQDGVALVFLVGQDTLHRGRAPARCFLSGFFHFNCIICQHTLSGGARDLCVVQLPCNDRRGRTLQKAPEDRAHNPGLGFNDLRRAVRTAAIAHELPIGHRYPAVCKALAHAPGYVLGDVPALLLGDAGHDRQQHLALAVQRVDVLLLEIDLHVMLLQLADGGQGVHRIPGEAGNRLGDDQVDLARQRILNHAVKALAFLRAGAGDALVGVDFHKLPVVAVFPGFDMLGVVLHLRIIAGQLLLAVGGYAGIRRNALGTNSKRGNARHRLQARRDYRDRPDPGDVRLISSGFTHCSAFSFLLWRCALVFSAALFRFSASQLSLRERSSQKCSSA